VGRERSSRKNKKEVNTRPEKEKKAESGRRSEGEKSIKTVRINELITELFGGGISIYTHRGKKGVARRAIKTDG